MSASLPSPDPGAASQKSRTEGACAHPRVQVVARASEGEFVECLECREIFEASEFRDMESEARHRNGAA